MNTWVFMRNVSAVILSIVLTCCFAGCPLIDSPDNSKCDAANQKSIVGMEVLHPDVAADERFTLITPEAKNDCEAHFLFSFRWADKNRSMTDSTRPPLDSLRSAFGPRDEFGYFPHPAEKRQFSNGFYSWAIEFDAGNKNSTLLQTRYSTDVHIYPSTSISEADSVLVVCTIQYHEK